MGRQNLSSLITNRYSVNRGGPAVVPAALVLTLTLPLERYDVRGVEFPLFQSAITPTLWKTVYISGFLQFCSQACQKNYRTRSCMHFFVTRRHVNGI